MTDASRRGFRPRALGEIAIRCADLEAMARFYEEVIGLERLTRDGGHGIVFFRIAEGFGGHTSVLALFRHDAETRPGLHPSVGLPPETGARSSLHHLALSLPFAEQQAAMDWYDRSASPTGWSASAGSAGAASSPKTRRATRWSSSPTTPR